MYKVLYRFERVDDKPWYSLSVTYEVHRWIMEQNPNIWDWEPNYAGTNQVDVSNELLILIKLKFESYAN